MSDESLHLRLDNLYLQLLMFATKLKVIITSGRNVHLRGNHEEITNPYFEKMICPPYK